MSWFLLVRETGIEPVRWNHTPLKRARLPVPPLPQDAIYYTTFFFICQPFFSKKIKNFSGRIFLLFCAHFNINKYCFFSVFML